MKLRAAALLLIVVIALCALASSYQHKPFLTPAIDAGSGVFPARVTVGGIICTPTTMRGPERAKIVTT